MLISSIYELCQIFAAFMNLEVMLIFIFIRAIRHLSILKVSGFFFLHLRPWPLKLQELLFASFKLFLMQVAETRR